MCNSTVLLCFTLSIIFDYVYNLQMYIFVIH